jgi:hypothetical protein
MGIPSSLIMVGAVKAGVRVVYCFSVALGAEPQAASHKPQAKAKAKAKANPLLLAACSLPLIADVHV